MCGIAGFIRPGLDRFQLQQRLAPMLSALSHRGPDDVGVWVDPSRGLALGHRRLAIRDVTAAGHQPMFSSTGRFGMIFNGEIYNVEELRQRLPRDLHWSSDSDTELLLHAIEQWGLDQTLASIAGMFAIGLYDRVDRTVTLIRDRLGIKPLYVSIQADRAFWSSELKALMQHVDFCAEINTEALAWYLRFGYVPAPHSILLGTSKLQPGSYLRISLDQSAAPVRRVYWDATETARAGRDCSRQRADEDWIEATEQLLGDVVRQHMLSDVPLGAFLSGGIDSSTIVSLMRSSSPRPLKTFSIGFEDKDFDEAPCARQIARHLQTDHQEHYVRERDILNLIPRWAEFYCEPFSDTSGLPCLVLSEFARRDVTVALTGDGGDELFAGYRRYFQTVALQERVTNLPHVVRQVLRSLLSYPPAGLCQRLTPLQRHLARRHVGDGLQESLRKARSILGKDSPRELYECVASISFGANQQHLMRGTTGQDASLISPDLWQAEWGLIENMQLWDAGVYLPNDILHKVDIASMSVGLEARVPLLDHRVFEWSWQVPHHLKCNRAEGKLILRRILDRHVPRQLAARPKRGFSAPLDQWLRTSLRDWAESLLEPTVLDRFNLLNHAVVAAYWQDFIAGRAGHARIWPVLVFLAWQQQYFTPPSGRNEHHLRNASSRSVSIGG